MIREELLQGSKWEILQLLSEAPRSTTELAKSLGTTQANVSQQLRHLELAGFIERKRAGKKGAHFLYHIVQEFTLMVHLSPHAAEKKTLSKTDEFLMRALTHKHKDALLGLAYGQSEAFSKMHAIGVFNRKDPEIFVITDGVEQFRKHHAKIHVTSPSGKDTITTWSHTADEVKAGRDRGEDYFLSSLKDLTILYDPKGVLAKLQAGLEDRP